MMSAIGEVNIARGDDVSKLLYEAATQTYDNRPGAVVQLHPSFSGLRVIDHSYKPAGCYELMNSDGVGTKIEVAERTGNHSTVAHDLVAMVCDDAVIRGAEPVALNTVLDVNKLLSGDQLTEEALRGIAAGYVAAAGLAKIVILNGELAELGNRVGGYGPFNYNWGATLLSYAHKDRLISGTLLNNPQIQHAPNGVMPCGYLTYCVRLRHTK